VGEPAPRELAVVVVGKTVPLGMLGFTFDPALVLVAMVGEVRPGQAGDKAGLRVGDVITRVDDIDVSGLMTSGVDRLIRDASRAARRGSWCAVTPSNAPSRSSSENGNSSALPTDGTTVALKTGNDEARP
jgi:hypothetical protein